MHYSGADVQTSAYQCTKTVHGTQGPEHLAPTIYYTYL